MREILKVQHENLQLPLSPKCGKKGKKKSIKKILAET